MCLTSSFFYLESRRFSPEKKRAETTENKRSTLFFTGHLKKDVEVGITGKMLEAIHDYIVCRGDITESDYLFVSHARGYKEAKLNPVMVSRIVKRRLREIGLDSKFLTCHSLRHNAAILSLKAGATIYDVQQMLGHVSIETTKIYLRAIEEETRINNRAVHTLDELF